MNLDFKPASCRSSNQVSAAMPMGGEEADRHARAVRPHVVTPAFESLGPAMHVMASKTGEPRCSSRPAAPDKVQTAARDDRARRWSLQPRDFLGETHLDRAGGMRPASASPATGSCSAKPKGAEAGRFEG